MSDRELARVANSINNLAMIISINGLAIAICLI
jgi:hypothetical protein